MQQSVGTSIINIFPMNVATPKLGNTIYAKGKSGGARVITFTLVVSQQDAVLNLLYIYDKADRASISEKEIEQLLKQNGLK